jgi:hypothetical protein
MPSSGPGLPGGPGGVQAAVLALANVAAGTRLSSAGAAGVQEHLAPGIMLAQASTGKLWHCKPCRALAASLTKPICPQQSNLQAI